MINMEHCRFENTAIALEECVNALSWDGLTTLSMSERACAKYLYEFAKEYIEEYEKNTIK